MRVSRDPFARRELHRLVVPKGECPWCGNKDAKYKYVIRTDDGRVITDKTPFSPIHKSGPFCNVTCFRDYNNLETKAGH